MSVAAQGEFDQYRLEQAARLLRSGARYAPRDSDGPFSREGGLVGSDPGTAANVRDFGKWCLDHLEAVR